jgi:hypothetical protein
MYEQHQQNKNYKIFKEILITIIWYYDGFDNVFAYIFNRYSSKYRNCSKFLPNMVQYIFDYIDNWLSYHNNCYTICKERCRPYILLGRKKE